MRFQHSTHAFLTLLAAVAFVRAGEPDVDGVDAKPPPPASRLLPKTTKKSADALSMSTAVACRSILGFEDYEPVPAATLTADEKLLVYYRPYNFLVEKSGDLNHVHLTQDGQIRRHGQKPILQRKEKLLEYEFKVAYQPNQVYLKNTISLKGLKPGEYDFDIILHDKLAKSEPATQVLSFKVVPPSLPQAESESAPAKDQPISTPSNRP